MKDDIDSLSMEDHILKKFLVLQIDSVLVIVDDVDGVSVVLEVSDLQCDPLDGLCGALWSLGVHPHYIRQHAMMLRYRPLTFIC